MQQTVHGNPPRVRCGIVVPLKRVLWQEATQWPAPKARRWGKVTIVPLAATRRSVAPAFSHAAQFLQ
jgi:hypothetical protein